MKRYTDFESLRSKWPSVLDGTASKPLSW